MLNEYEYGETIAYERSMVCVSAEQLCEGLCSAEHLRKIEKGKRICEKILADALLQRLGVSTDKFSYLLRKREYQETILREKIVFLIDTNQREEAMRCLEEYRIRTKEEHILSMQFYKLANAILEWNYGEPVEQIQRDLLEAWNFTKKGKELRIKEKEYYSFFEFALLMLEVRLLEEKGEAEKAETGYQEMLFYLENRILVQDQVKWYPQIAYRQMRLLKRKGNIGKALEIGGKALKLLKGQASSSYLIEILGEYSKLLENSYQLKEESIPSDKEKQLIEMEWIRGTLSWLYQEYEIQSKEKQKDKREKWNGNLFLGMSEIYFCQDVIRGRRLGMGMTQAELSEGICDPVTISRIERGESFPKRKVLVALLQKLKWSGENSTLTAQIGRPEYHRNTSEISMLTHTGKLAEAEKLLEKLEQKVQKKDIFAEQYFQANMSVIKYGLKKIDAQTLYNMEKEAFYLTVPNGISEKQLNQWHFSRTEVMCVNGMSYCCENLGKEKEVLELLLVIKEFYERQPFQLKYYRAGYELTLRNIGNLLGNMGKYEEAIEAADKCISLALSLGKVGNVAIALYDKGWNMEKLWKKQVYTKEESFAYIKASYALNLFLDKDIQCKFIKNHIKELYNEDI